MTTSPTCIPYINMYFFSISNMGPWLKSLWIVLVSIMTLPWLSKILNINNSQSFLIYICYHLYKINICITWYFFHAIFNDPDFLFIFLTLCNVFFFFIYFLLLFLVPGQNCLFDFCCDILAWSQNSSFFYDLCIFLQLFMGSNVWIGSPQW